MAQGPRNTDQHTKYNQCIQPHDTTKNALTEAESSDTYTIAQRPMATLLSVTLNGLPKSLENSQITSKASNTHCSESLIFAQKINLDKALLLQKKNVPLPTELPGTAARFFYH